jgi:hypothetical protein
MITIFTPPNGVYYVVQMKSDATGKWVDTMANQLETEDDLTRSLRHWRMIHPLRQFRPVRRTVTDQPLIEVTN